VAKVNDKPVKIRSPWTRAILPNLGGLAVLSLIGLMLWGFAAFISRGDTATSDRLAPSILRVGSVTNVADEIIDKGPILFPGLGTTDGERTIVLDHTGDDPSVGWVVYYAYPAGGDESCVVEQVRDSDGKGTRRFTDCDGNIIDVSELSPPPRGVNPVVENQRLLSIDLSGVTSNAAL
tara:strand:- start:3438 stop:3971 length:534 start_codon:yes stop_codon:yes gene_type:complete